MSVAGSALRAARSTALGLVRRSGAAGVVRSSAWRRQRFLVLCYHGVSTRDEHRWSDLYVDQDHLARRLEWLRRHRYEVLPLGTALELQSRGALPPAAVAITFDDGAADFATRAMPVLGAAGVPVMVYQTTYYVDSGLPVFNPAVSWVMWHAHGRRVQLPGETEATVMPEMGLDGAFRRRHGALLAWAQQQGLDTRGKQALLEEVARVCGVELADVLGERRLQLMTSSELRALDPRQVAIELHTHRHRTPNDAALFRREIDDNRRALASLLGRPYDGVHFCYPSGVHVPAFSGWLRDAGVLSATTCDTGLTSTDTDRMFVPRLIDTMHTPDEVFEGWLNGSASFLSRRRA